MLVPPDLRKETIVDSLRDAWGLNAVQVFFLPLGADLSSAVYHAVTTEDAAWFLKLRSGPFSETSVMLPRLLCDQGIEQVIAPLPTTSGRLWAEVAGFSAVLYPFIAGVDGYQRALSKHQWRDFGAALRRIHAVDIPAELKQRIAQETFSPTWRDMVRRFLAGIEANTFADPTGAQLAAFLREKRSEVLELVDVAGDLAHILQAQPRAQVLCHSDLHAGNLLIAEDGTSYIVDWDAPIMAPRERDLMYVGGGQMAGWLTPDQEEVLFYHGYGDAPVDQIALAYYRYQRIVEDIAVFCQQLLLSNDGGEDRPQALRYLMSNFQPEGAIAIARAQDKTGFRGSFPNRSLHREVPTIREAVRADADALSTLAMETYADAFGDSLRPEDLAAHQQRHLSPARMHEFISGDTVLLAELDGRLVGFVQFGPYGDDVELRRLYVHQRYQNRGVGSRLLEAALAHPFLAAAPRIVLDVWERNHDARRLYERFGFEVVGRQRFEVESDAETDPDLIMARVSCQNAPAGE